MLTYSNNDSRTSVILELHPNVEVGDKLTKSYFRLKSKCSVDKNGFITAVTDKATSVEYAFRLYKDGNIIEKKGYQKESKFTFRKSITHSEASLYSVKFFCRSDKFGIYSFQKALLTEDKCSETEEASVKEEIPSPPFNGETLSHGLYSIDYFKSLGISHYFKRSPSSNILFVTFHGSIPPLGYRKRNFQLPCFRLYDLNIKNQPSVLCFSDILLEVFSEDAVYLSWFLDTKKHKQADKISKIIENYLKVHCYDEVIFHGSSGGGHIALYMASRFHQTAIVSNCQFELEKHGQFKDLRRAVSSNQDELIPFDLEHKLKGLTGPQKIISYCNTSDYTYQHHEFANSVVENLFPGCVEPIFFDGNEVAIDRKIKNHSVGYPNGEKIQEVLERYLRNSPLTSREN